MNKTPSVLSLYDKTGNMVLPWLRNGYNATIVDLQHPKGSNTEETPWGTKLTKVGANALEYTPSDENWACLMGFPPCTDNAVSGARWFQKKLQENPNYLEESLALFGVPINLAKKMGVPYMVENPVVRREVHQRYGRPSFYFHPYEYAGYLDQFPDVYPQDPEDHRDRYTKKTAIWHGNDFVVPEKNIILPDPKWANFIHRQPPGPERANIRSVTPRGFAEAVFLANQNKFYKAWRESK